MSLRKYQAKRSFGKTTEPKGRLKSPGKRLIFVVQKHAASHLHFDFRLEADGVLKSWAVPKGIPQPGEKHLAMMVEDHPFDYKDFEGTIPPGNYGAGTVMIWDNGTYRSIDSADPNETEKYILNGIKKGDFKIILEGQKLKGEFVLAKLKKGKENSWLMFQKKSDEEVGSGIDPDVSVASGKTMDEIAKKVNLKKIEGAKKAKMPEFIRPMKAMLASEPFDRPNWIFEIKLDGYRVIARKQNKDVMLYSRNRKNFNDMFSSIRTSLEKIPGDFILDGEVVAIDHQGRSDFQLLQNYLTQKMGTLIYYVFDILYLDGYNLEKTKLTERKKILQNFLLDLGNVRSLEFVEEKGIKVFEIVTKAGIEGIIGKSKNSIYQEGARSPNWIKVKAIQNQEAVVGGFTEPKGGRKKFGALVLGVYEGNDLIYIGHTGGGFDEKGLDYVFKKMQPLITKKSPFKVEPKTNTPATWVRPEVVCQVKFSQWTADGMMRQPVFLGLREDKDPKEVRRELPDKEIKHPRARLWDIPEFGSGRKSKKNVTKNKRIFSTNNNNKNKNEQEIIIDGKKIKITNLEKIFWPEEKYTKGDLIDYYRKVSKYILPYLVDRPESLNRFPNGIKGKYFFQKDMKDAPDWLETVEIFSDSDQKKVNYMLCQDEADLVYMANLASIEINPWNSRIGSLDYPDYVVLDIDPLDVPFSDAIKVARETKKVLDEIKIKGYVKTSGAKGLHVFIPTGAKYSYEQVREFALLLNTIINSSLPDITSLERSPQARKKKVYLDYLQNSRGQTMAAPYSVRPRPGATVSMPLEWEEVNGRLDPAKFTIKTIFKRLEKKGDPWKGISKQKLDMGKALDNINKLMEK